MNNVTKYNGKLNVTGTIIKKYRKSKKLSLAQLSNALQLFGIDIPKPSIQGIENGRRIVKEYEFYAICKVLGVSMEEMLKDFAQEIENI